MHISADAVSSFLIRRSVAMVLALSAASAAVTHFAHAEEADVANLSDMNVTADAFRALSTEPSAASFGFAKPLLETPRTVRFVSEEQLRMFGVSTVEDLSRLVPGTYSTTRYGLQGGINIRGVSADFYYRGMKRLNMQGHVRTVLSAYDNIEVIKGPPSPLYGLGKIGGYANLEPKSGRARTGKYLTKESGYLQSTIDSYGKNEMQFGVGKPFTIGDRAAAVYFVGLLEDSKTFVKTVEAHQKFIQGTMSVDNVVGNFRLETGGQMQNSKTSGAYFTRVTQNLVDNHAYITGRPMANLDVNGDGRVGFVETYIASPTQANNSGVRSISATNGALLQRYNLKRDSNNNPIPLSQYANTINGIPQSYIDYLNGHPEINCQAASIMRAMPAMQLGSAQATPTATNLTTGAGVNAAPGTVVGGLVTTQIPVGFALNPCTVSTQVLNRNQFRSNGAFERLQDANQAMIYFDLINDINPDFTMKNQVFYDSLSSYKDSWLPYGENQSIRTLEEKFTMTRRIPADKLPDWLAVNTLGSVNYRRTSGYIRSSGGDFDFRQDITYNTYGTTEGSGTGGFYPNTMFWTQLTNADYATGAVNTTWRKSLFSESGIGLMADIDIFRNTNVVLGGRIDTITAKSQEKQDFNATTGTYTLLTAPTNPNSYNNSVYTQQQYALGNYCAAWASGCPGVYMTPGITVRDSQSGKSWNVSVSHKLPWFNLVPYITKASTTLTLDTSNNLYTASTIAAFSTNASGSQTGVTSFTNKILGQATLLEGGVKGAALRGRLQWALAGYKQERVDVSAPTDPSSTAEVSSTVTKGIEGNINWQITKKWYAGLSGSYSDARYIVGASNLAVDVNARDLGFKDIVDGNGNVLVPAEALLYGGRVSVRLDDPNNVYDKVPGTPDYQAALQTTYALTKKLTLLGNLQYNSWSWGSRLQTLKIPAATTLNLGITWDSGRLHLKGNVYNVTDDLQFRATNGSGNRNMASVLPGRRYEGSFKIDF